MSDSEQSYTLDTDEYDSSPHFLQPLLSNNRGEIITARGSESIEEDVQCVIQACAANPITECGSDGTWVSSTSTSGSPCSSSGEDTRSAEWRQSVDYYEARRHSARRKRLFVEWTPSYSNPRNVRNTLKSLRMRRC